MKQANLRQVRMRAGAAAPAAAGAAARVTAAAACTALIALGGGGALAARAATAPAAAPAPGAPAINTQDPTQLVQDVASNILKALDADRAAYRNDPAKVRELADKYLLPYFDTDYAAQLVLGRNWRSATPDQRARFIQAFQNSMLQNYGNALVDFTANRLKVLPSRTDPGSNLASVRTQITRDDGTAVPVIYVLHKTPQGWKAWDVVIEGISYVKSFRDDFAAQIQQNGLEAVIQRLQSGAKPPGLPVPGGAAAGAK